MAFNHTAIKRNGLTKRDITEAALKLAGAADRITAVLEALRAEDHFTTSATRSALHNTAADLKVAMDRLAYLAADRGVQLPKLLLA